MLTVDLETKTPGKKPDFRVDEVERVGWLEDGAETAYWSKCFCPMSVKPGDSLLGHHLMYDLGIMWRECWDVPSLLKGQLLQVEDTLALAYCQGEEDMSLKGLGQKYLGVQTVPFEQQNLIGEDQYHAQDLWVTQRLLPILKEKQRGTAYDIDRRLIPALIDCSYRGYEIDQDRLEQAIEQAEQTCAKTKNHFERLVVDARVLKANRKITRKKWPEDVTGLYGDDIVVGEGNTRQRQTWGPPDIGSPTQLQQFFGVPSVDKDIIRDIANGGGPLALPAFFRREWAKADKLLDTYFYPARGLDKLTGLFNIYPGESGEGGASTGRLSSERANMQNQPPEMERCLRAPEGFLIIRGDYGQIELRSAAEMSSDEYLIKAFQEGRDLHEETRQFLGLDSRTKAKNFNFGAGLYGGGVGYISQVVGCPPWKVAGLMRKHRELWGGWWEWSDQHWLDVQRTGLSISPEPFRHVRRIPLLNPESSYKQALNHPPQSFAIYITKEAMNRLFYDGWRLCNQVHDAVYAYIPEDGNIPLLTEQFKRIMEDTAWEYLPRIGAPVDVSVSKYWHE